MLGACGSASTPVGFCATPKSEAVVISVRDSTSGLPAGDGAIGMFGASAALAGYVPAITGCRKCHFASSQRYHPAVAERYCVISKKETRDAGYYVSHARWAD